MALSIQLRTSFAAAGVYFSSRILRRSLSSEVTDAMMEAYRWAG